MPIINPSGVEWCNYNCNHYVGCDYCCTYPCYALAMLKNKLPHIRGNQTELQILKQLKKDLKTLEPGVVFMSSMSDCYQPLEEALKLTRNVLKTALPHKDWHFLILTKSSLVLRDYDIIQKYNNVEVGWTFTSLRKNPYEPNAPSPEMRIAVAKVAKDKGIKTFGSMEPIIPKITDPVKIMKDLSVTNKIIDRWILGSFNKNRRVIKEHIPWYKENYPDWLRFMRTYNIDGYVKEELKNAVEVR